MCGLFYGFIGVCWWFYGGGVGGLEGKSLIVSTVAMVSMKESDFDGIF